MLIVNYQECHSYYDNPGLYIIELEVKIFRSLQRKLNDWK
jgi:hypothetical protein